jgi:uncharacterized membrane protein
MSTPYAQSPVRISAGTAVKLGFFAALGAFLFWLIVSVFFLVIGLILAAAGLLAGLPSLPR